MPRESLLKSLKNRKLVQWGIAYLAGAWVLAEVSDVVGGRWDLPDSLYQGLFILLGTGFFVTLVLAWYHGEKGRQRVSGPELLMVTALLVVAGVALSTVHREERAPEPQPVLDEREREDPRPGIAVLPFENLSPNPGDAYFADGMQEEITAKLSTLSALRVISRSSVMQYREERPSSPQIAEELGVDFLVEGSARVAGGRVRLTVQLIDAISDEHNWTESYNLNLNAEDLFEVEGEVARQVAFQIGVSLTPEERDEVGRVLTDNTEAYLLFMQGTEAYTEERVWGRFSSDYRSAQLLEQAVRLDPEFALAHARFALSLLNSSSQEEQSRGREEAELALSLMPGLPEGRLALGVSLSSSGQTDEAIRQFQAAEAESPNLAQASLMISGILLNRGDFEAGFRTLRRAERLDPRNPIIQRSLARGLIFNHQYDEALEANRIREEVLPTYAGVRDRLWIHLLKGDSTNAQATVSELLKSDAWGFYNFGTGNPYDVVRRVLTREEGRIALESLLDWTSEPVGPCPEAPYVCLRRALHEEELGSVELARAYWDSLRVFADTRSSEVDAEYPIFIHMGLGDKEAAIRKAEEYVQERAEFEYYAGPSASILLARVLSHFGEFDRAMDILEEELPAPSWISVPILQVDPIWDSLRDNPRFQALLRRFAEDVHP